MNGLNESLKTYLDTLKALPSLPSEKELRAILASAGWSEQDIQAGLNYLGSTSAVSSSEPAAPAQVALSNLAEVSEQSLPKKPAPVTSEAVIPPESATVIPEPESFAKTDAMPAPNLDASSVAQEATPPLASAPGEPIASKKRFVVGALVLFFVVVAGGVAIAYSTGFIGGSKTKGRALSTEDFWSTFLPSLESIHSGEYTVALSLKSVPRGADAEPLPDGSYEDDLLYNSDMFRLEFVRELQARLHSYFVKNGRMYPATLKDAKLDLDATTASFISYRPVEGGKKYEIDLRFESSRAFQNADMLYVPLRKEGLTMTFKETLVDRVAPEEGATVGAYTSIADTNSWLIPPVDTIMSASASGMLNNEGLQYADGRMRSSGDTSIPLFQGGFEVEWIRKDGVHYFMLARVPAILANQLPPTLLNRFVRVKDEQLQERAPGFIPAMRNDEGKVAMLSEQKQNFILLFKELVQSGSLIVGPDVVKDASQDGSPWKYTITIDEERFRAALIQAAALHGAKSEAFQDVFDNPRVARDFDYILRNMSIVVWRDDTTNIFRGVRVQGTIVPPDSVTQWQGKQLSYEITYTLKNINKPISIEAPETYIDIEDVEREMRASFAPSLQSE